KGVLKWKEEMVKVGQVLPGADVAEYFSNDAKLHMPEFHGYPRLNTSSELYVATLDTQPKVGPAGPVLSDVKASKGLGLNTYHRSRCWIDPTRSHLAMQYELGDCKIQGQNGVESLVRRKVMENLEKSPRGIWYPTVVRLKFIHTDLGKEAAKPTRVEEQAFYF